MTPTRCAVVALSVLLWSCTTSSEGTVLVGEVTTADVLETVDAPADEGTLIDILAEVGPLPDAVADAPVPPADGQQDAEPHEPDATTDAEVAADAPMGWTDQPLLVSIVDPGDGERATTMTSFVGVRGIALGNLTEVSWTLADQSGAAPVVDGAFEVVAQLEPGDNVITVSGSDGETTQHDVIVITYTPGFLFDRRLAASPAVGFVGETPMLTFDIAFGAKGASATDPQLLRVDAEGEPLETVAPLQDDGVDGDRLPLDGVYSARVAVSCAEPGPQFFRAVATATSIGTPYQAHSEVLVVECVPRYSAAACSTDMALLALAESQLAAGADPATVASTLEADPLVAAAGTSSAGGDAVWARFQSGVLGAALGPATGIRGGGGPPGGPVPPWIGAPSAMAGSRDSAVLAPAAADLGATDDAVDVAALLESGTCHPYPLVSDGPLQNGAASLERFRALKDLGFVSISGHGEALFDGQADLYGWDHDGAQETIWTGEPVVCTELAASSPTCTIGTPADRSGTCPSGMVCATNGSAGEGICVDLRHVDLARGRLALTPRGYAITPAFVQRYSGTEGAFGLVNLGTCSSLYNGSMAVAWLARGASGVSGFSGVVDSAWARGRVLDMVQGLVAGEVAQDAHAIAQDPNHDETFWRYLGRQNLRLHAGGMVNGGWDALTHRGWRPSDFNSHVVHQFGNTFALQGHRAALLTTGLGGVGAESEVEQALCLPADTQQIDLYWRIYIEDYANRCGDLEGDRLQITLEFPAGTFPLYDVSLNDLCPPEGGSCGDCPEPAPCDLECMGTGLCNVSSGQCANFKPCTCGAYAAGLLPSDVQFGAGGVGMSGWQSLSRDIASLPKGPATLRVRVSKATASGGDAVVLVDDVQLD